MKIPFRVHVSATHGLIGVSTRQTRAPHGARLRYFLYGSFPSSGHFHSPQLYVACLAISSRRGSTSSTPPAGTRKPEVIALESIEVEVMSLADSDMWRTGRHTNAATAPTASPLSNSHNHGCGGDTDDAAHGASGTHGSDTDTTTRAATDATAPIAAAAHGPPTAERWHHELRHASYWDVVQVDPFARSRITNFVRRAGNPAASVFEARKEVMSSPGEQTVHIATCRLPLPEPHYSYVAEGIAASEKDAVLLAAMHAERVCDALGVPLFRLPSMQQRHAAAARAEGRYAPMPGDPVRPAGTVVPPPLRMLPGMHYQHNMSESISESEGVGGHAHSAIHRGDDNAEPHESGVAGKGSATPSGMASDHARGTHHPKEARGSSGAAPSPSPLHTPLFSPTVAEAEVVEPSTHNNDAPSTNDSDSTNGSNQPGSLFGGRHAVSCLDARIGHQNTSSAEPYHACVWLPWTESAGGIPTTASTTTVADSHPSNMGCTGGSARPTAGTVSTLVQPPMLGADVATFDPTEGGLWEMVNTVSTRCSPTPQDALVLPCVYEPAALERIKDYFLQHRVAMAKRTFVATVAVPGSPTRMYVVELHLVAPTTSAATASSASSTGATMATRTATTTATGVVVARGKAQTREAATHLAAMHAELLLDALGWPLFPNDPQRQSRHARAAAGFGRWAPDPFNHTSVIQPPAADAALPRPLKQQVGGDEVWLHPMLMHRANAHPRTNGERAIRAMNVLNAICGDYVEVNPPLEWLAESVELLRRWQTDVARNPYPELYVITAMGDFYRATTLTPTPRAYGLRGGNAIGRTIEQAVQLCAMHAVDGLCALGIPLIADPREQARFEWRRRHCGLVTAAAMCGMTRPKGLVSALKPSIVAAQPDMHAATAAASSEGAGMPAYLPGYIIEGSARRLPPVIHDTLAILQLAIPQDFATCGGGVAGARAGAATTTVTAPSPPSAGSPSAQASQPATNEITPAAGAEVLQMIGNDAKTCVQNYLRHQHAIRKQACQVAQNGKAKTGTSEDSVPVSAEEQQKLEQWLADQPLKVTPDVYITGYGKQVSVHNIAYLRVPAPLGYTVTNTSSSNVKAAETTAGAGGINTDEVNTGNSSSSAQSNGGEITPATSTVTLDTPPLLAIGISLKKKDAERVCYVHAAALLQYHYGMDVVRSYRAGLPRQGSTTSFDEVRAKLLPADYGEGFVRDWDGEGQAQVKLKPLMHFVMQEFMNSGRHFTAPRKRPSPGPYSPF